MRILFLCLGNICRSPTAKGVFRQLARQAGLAATLDSAGTGGWHAGEPPCAGMQRAALRRGYDLSGLSARQISAADFTRFDLILAMDSENLRDAQRLCPKGAPARIEMFLQTETGTQEVPDPWYSHDFDGCLTIIEAGAKALLARLQGAQ